MAARSSGACRVGGSGVDALWAYVRRKKASPTDEAGEVWQSTMVDMDSRLRAARGIGEDETQASIEVFQTLKQRGHPDGPPPTISDGWSGIERPPDSLDYGKF